MKQYHQIGYKFDMKYRNMGSELAKAKVRASADRRGKRLGTVAAEKSAWLGIQGTSAKQLWQSRIKRSK